MEMKNPLTEFLFGSSQAPHHCGFDAPFPTSFADTIAASQRSNYHEHSSFAGTPAAASSAIKSAGGALAKMKAAAGPRFGPPSSMNPNGYNQFPDPEQVGINPSAEISRINTNIAIYNGVIAASAIGIGVTMCLFIRSIYKAPKGVHGGDSDDEMESDSESEGSDES
jgi:hypothetical protein